MQEFTLEIRGKIYEYTRPAVMGILNITPDSFFAGSRVMESDKIKRQVQAMIADGADIIDVGACSTRPGYTEISVEEETSRLRLAIDAIREVAPEIPLSVDTYRAAVVSEVVQTSGADIVNDISGGNFDENMFDTVARLKVPYILTHSRGNAQSVHSATEYTDLMADVISDIGRKLSELYLKGVNDVIIDPGFGFSKDLEQNYELLRRMDELTVLGAPILAGLSRKSMITKLLNIETDDALTGTAVLNTIALSKGASILRVHDVKAAVQTIKLCQYIQQ